MGKDDALEAKRDQLALAAGKVLAEWSMVEAAVSFLFASLLDQTDVPVKDGIVVWEDEEPSRRMGHTIISAIIGFPARVDVLSAVFDECDCEPELKSIWPGMAARLKKKYRSRHEAAHFVITNHEQEDGNWIPYLTPFASSIGSYSDKTLTVHDLHAKIDSFYELRLGLTWIMHEVEVARGRKKEPPLPVPPLIQRVRRALETQNPSKQ